MSLEQLFSRLLQMISIQFFSLFVFHLFCALSLERGQQLKREKIETTRRESERQRMENPFCFMTETEKLSPTSFSEISRIVRRI
jgi:hypothetical protein